MRQGHLWPRVVAGLGLAWGVATMPTPANATYALVGEIAVPPSATNPFTGQFTTYDISFFDPKTQLDYVADRTNAVVDVFSAATNTFVGRIGSFQGIQPAPPAQPANNAISGPDGVVVVNGAVGLPNQHQLWVGDGNSTLAGFNLPGNTPIAGTPISTVLPGSTAAMDKRVDEGAFDPKDNVLAFANNAASPTPFTTLINAATNAKLAQTIFDGTKGTPAGVTGIEQPAWDKVTQKFYIAVDQDPGAGGIAAMDPLTGLVTKYYNFNDPAFLGAGAKCGPTGVAASNIGGGTQLTIACGATGTQSLIFDPSANGGNGAILKSFNQVSGGDQVWFDPTTGLSFLTGLDPSGSNRLLGIVDLNNLANIALLQTLPTGPGAHSVAVDPISGEAFVPVGAFVPYPNPPGGWGTSPGSAAACGQAIGNNGCILVFGQVVAAVPEPASLTLMMTAFAGFAGLVWSRRRRQS